MCLCYSSLKKRTKRVMKDNFRTELGAQVFRFKYANGSNWSWYDNCVALVNDVCKGILPHSVCKELVQAIYEFKFIPGGRYLYYAGREARFYNNCFLFKSEEDSREDWADLVYKATSALMTGGGIGNDYSVYRPHGSYLGRTGGDASGPIPLMKIVNEIGRNVMQGGSRRSAIYASLNWQHGDVERFLTVKNWDQYKIDGSDLTIAKAKEHNFDYPAPLDMTNISVNYDNAFLKELDEGNLPKVFIENVRQALKTAEPGFSFNFGDKENETARNACTEVTSADDSDVCNLGSINLANISQYSEFARLVYLGSVFLVCGTLKADLPFDKVYKVREKNRRLGLGLMGMHEWLLKKGYRYEVVPELHQWLDAYAWYSEHGANELCDELGISRPIAYRAIAPTGTIGILAGTTTGIEPIYSVAYKRRFLEGTTWKAKYCIDATAKAIIESSGIDPESVETARSLAYDVERRIKFQADVQDYVDMAISSTCNLPEWGSEVNNEDTVKDFAKILAKYAPRLRGFTCYPDGSRGGQPITEISYKEAAEKEGIVIEENDSCKGGVCGV